MTQDAIENYCIQHSSKPSKDCEQIESFTRAQIPMSVMLVGPLEGAFLGWMVRALGAKRVLEIGTFTGYSALCMAEHLPPDGELITCDINQETSALAKKFWSASKAGGNIKSLVGPASQTLGGVSGAFDIIFIDADKEAYPLYFDKALELLSPGGVIILDNCLRDGRVLEAEGQVDSGTRAIMHLNAKIANRHDLVCCLLPLRDGVMMVQRRDF